MTTTKRRRTADTSGPVMPVVSAAVVDAMATAAHEAYLLASLYGGNLASIKSGIRAEPYWPKFCEIVRAGEVDADWLGDNAALGRAIFGWAKAEWDDSDTQCGSFGSLVK